LGIGQLAPPTRKGARLGFAAVPLEFQQTQEQVAQGGHDVSAAPPADARSVFAQTDIPAIVRAVFAARPVIPDGLEQLRGVVLLGSGAGAVVTVFLRFGSDFTLAQFLALSPHGDQLPAAAQAGRFGAKGGSLQAPAHQSPMFFKPAGVVFRGKKNAVAA